MSKKQVVLIMTDTQRKDMVGAYGNDFIATPNIDSLAQNGVRYEKAYCTCPLCAPSRSSIFTGTFPHTNHMTSNAKALSPLVKNIGERLQAESIRTCYIGKWHLDGGDYFGDGVCPDGFDDEYWFDMRNYLETMSPEDRQKSRWHESMLKEEWTAEKTFAYQCVDRAIDFLNAHSNEDFFLVLSFDEPHHPWLCPREYFDKFENYKFPDYGNLNDSLENKPYHQKLWAQDIKSRKGKGADNQRHLLACNDFVDTQIGRFLEKLNALDCDDRTIIYTSDHGASFSAHGFDDKGPAMYDEITNIPLIFSNKNWSKSQEVNENIATNLDITPTVLDLFGIKIPQSLEGKSMLPSILSGEKLHDNIYMEFSRFEIDNDGFGGYQPLRCVFDGRYKLTVNLLATDELYDLENDKGELNNLINSKDHAEIRNKLHDALIENMYTTRDELRGYQFENRPWREDKTDSWQCHGQARQRVTDENEKRQCDYSTGLEIESFVRHKQL